MEEAKEAITAKLEKMGVAKRTVNYHFRECEKRRIYGSQRSVFYGFRTGFTVNSSITSYREHFKGIVLKQCSFYCSRDIGNERNVFTVLAVIDIYEKFILRKDYRCRCGCYCRCSRGSACRCYCRSRCRESLIAILTMLYLISPDDRLFPFIR